MDEPNSEVMALADKRALEFLRLDATTKDYKVGAAELITKQAIFGFRLKQEVGKEGRALRQDTLRAVHMIATNPEERKRYIEETMPRMLPPVKAK